MRCRRDRLYSEPEDSAAEVSDTKCSKVSQLVEKLPNAQKNVFQKGWMIVSKRGRQGDQSDAPLLTGRASSPEQDSGATATDEWSWNKEKSQPKRSSSKPSGDWENWGEGWSETWNSSNPSSPLKGTSSSENSSKKSSTAKSKKKTKESLLIDFEDEKSSDKDEWNSKWDDDEAWKMLNKHD